MFSTPFVLRALLVALATLVLTACAPSTLVTLLPQANGRPSAVVVTSAKGSLLVDKPYSVAQVQDDGTLSLTPTTAQEVAAAYPLLMLQPPPPAKFVLEFEPGTSSLTAASGASLADVIKTAQARAGGEIVITGHTDRQGTREANDALSLERAQAIRQLLIEQGFKGELIEAVGRGEREPVVPTEDEVAEPRNRRADIVVR